MDLIEAHGPALEYDLLTLTHYQLKDVGGALPWGALLHFVMHLPRTSALSRELVPRTDLERWADGEMTATIMADIFDAIAQGFASITAAIARRSAKRIKPYPRPWLKPKVTHVGSGAIPVSDFERWWGSGRRH